MKIKGRLEKIKAGWQLAAVDERAEPIGRYLTVTHDEGFLHLVSDDYEGRAMLDIELLPELRSALADIARELAAKAKRAKKEAP